MQLLIIDNYDSFVYNLIQLVEQSGFLDYQIRKNDDLLSLNPNDFDKVLISPGPGIASEAGQLVPFIKKYYALKPMLGVCLGHEAIAEVFGAGLTQLEKPLHGIKNQGEIVKNHYVFGGLPNQFNIGHYHSWIVNEEDLTDKFNVLMYDVNQLVMAYHHKQYDLTGLMFHPESIMTDFGLDTIRNWIRH